MADLPETPNLALGLLDALGEIERGTAYAAIAREIATIARRRPREHADLPSFVRGPYLVGSEDAASQLLAYRLGQGSGALADVLLVELAAAYEHADPDHSREEGEAELRAALEQIGAVAIQWIEAIDRRAGR